MIWFFSPGGRTGNQLFQYAYLESIRRGGERVLTTQFARFKKQFRLGPGWLSFDSWWAVNFCDHFVSPFFYHVLVRTRLVSSVMEADGRMVERKGLFGSFIFVRGYFQNQDFWAHRSNVATDLLPRAAHEVARKFLAQVPAGRTPVFVHLRRGDYLTWSVLGRFDATLPLSYYRQAHQTIEARCPRPYYVITGDDPDYGETALNWLGDLVVSRNSPVVDLAIMAQCQYGVLSNSTLAWWGGYWMQNRALALVPETWLGFKSGVDYPAGIVPRWAEVVPLKSWYSEVEAL